MEGGINDQGLGDWLTKKQFLEEVKLLTKAGLNDLMFYRDQNGLAPYVKLVKGRLYISRSGFAEWFLSHDDKGRRPPKQKKPRGRKG